MSDFRTVDLGIARRQSLWAVVFLAFRTLRSIGVVQLLLFIGFVVARLPSIAAVIGLATVIGIALFLAAALRWWRYTFEIVDDELVVRRGVFQQQRLSIPLGRVQSVSLEQKLLHRMVSLVQISLDTAGAETAEFVIDAVDRDVARTLQEAVANHRGSEPGPSDPDVSEPPPPDAGERVLLRHEPLRIVKIALSQPPFAGLVLIAPLVAVADELGRFLPVDLPRIDEPTGPGWLLWFVPLLLIVGLTVSVILNLARVLLTEWNLTVHTTAAGLRRNAGLISTTSVASPIPRVQILDMRQGPIERRWSLRRVQLATIGHANLSVPGCSTDQAKMIRNLVLVGSPGVSRVTQPVSRAEILLRTRTAALLALVSATILVATIGWWGLVVLVVVPMTAAATARQVRLRRWGIVDDAVAVQNEFVSWHRQEALLRKMNTVTVSQRLFERSRGLATVTLSTAAGAIKIGMLPLEQANEIRDRALYAVETDRRPWM